MFNKKITVLILGLFIILMAATAFGMPILHGTQLSVTGTSAEWYADDPEGRQARAIISTTSSSSFQIILINEAAQTYNPPDVLMGILFGTVDGASSLVATGVTGTPESVDPNFVAIHGDNLSGEWGFLAGIDGTNGGFGEWGVSSSSFDPGTGAPAGWEGFGAKSLIDDAYMYPNSSESPNGPSFGITTGDPSLFKSSSLYPYVMDQVVINFSGSISPSMIDEVHFLYGTSYEGSVPEPSTMLLLGSGLIGLGAFRRKFKK